MKRRQFIALAGGAATLPLAARAQQGGGKRRIGVLMSSAENDPEGQARIAAFREGLLKLGWAEGREIVMENRFAAGRPDQFQALGNELIALAPGVAANVTLAMYRE